MKKLFTVFIFFVLIFSRICSVHAAPGDTTWVTTFDEEFQNWPDVHYHNYILPDTTHHWQKIIMAYQITCPVGGCDPWDRLGWINLYTDTAANSPYYEIMRVITPYNIVGGNLPGTCTYRVDVTDYMPLLHDTVRLGSYIESWIGGNQGWVVTVRLAFIEGEVYYKPFKVININQDHNVVYGDSVNPPSLHLLPKTILIDPQTAKVNCRQTTTGHGQGNTDNACEFTVRWHGMSINADSVIHNLWRSDCGSNPCSPQGGTWQYARAGWCPGSEVRPWVVDITNFVTIGANNTFGYKLQPYTNFCSPNNPHCVNGTTCADCNYNGNGHTEPHWTIESQIILYRLNPVIGINNTGGETPSAFRLEQNYPNPFNPTTIIKYVLERNSQVKITVYNSVGELVRVIVDKYLVSGEYKFEFDGSELASGIYFYKMETNPSTGSGQGFTETKKMMLIK